MKQLLIISPSFPPVNAADMHRVRQSIPYFREFGWEPVVVVVKPEAIESNQDPLLLDTVPDDVEVIKIQAFSTHYTRKLGLGSLALRSMWFYYRQVNTLLQERKFDLIYFSTTMFPLPILGRLWKKRFKLPFIIDMQDPWLTDYYLSKPKEERPPKFWFSYRLNQLTEPFAMKSADGIVAVSEAYHHTLQERYNNITPNKCLTLTFGAFDKDFDVLGQNEIQNSFFDPSDGYIHIPYIGRSGHDMRFSLSCIFHSLQRGIHEAPDVFKKVKMYFIGTSYAGEGKGIKTVEPIAQKYGVADYVTESTDRIPYFQALKLLKDASMLLIPGSDDPKYTASKLYNYILAKKPLLAVFHEESSVVNVIRYTKSGLVVTYSRHTKEEELCKEIYSQWHHCIINNGISLSTDWDKFSSYSARNMTDIQSKFFNSIIYTNDNE